MVGTDVLLSTRLGTDYTPAVAYSPDGQFLVVWRCDEEARRLLCRLRPVLRRAGRAPGRRHGPRLRRDAPGPAGRRILAGLRLLPGALDRHFAEYDVNGLLLSSDGSIIVDDLFIYDGTVSGDAFGTTVASNAPTFTWRGSRTRRYFFDLRPAGQRRRQHALPGAVDRRRRWTTRESPAVAYNPFAVPANTGGHAVRPVDDTTRSPPGECAPTAACRRRVRRRNPAARRRTCHGGGAMGCGRRLGRRLERLAQRRRRRLWPGGAGRRRRRL